jgi:penicillin-binding protein 2
MKNKFFVKSTKQSFNSRLKLLIVFFIILFLVLLGNIARLQILNFSEFSAQSKNNQISISPIAPVRGKIYDRNGILLAGNRLNYDLYLIPNLVKDIEKTIEIAQEFGNVSENQKKDLRQSFETKRHYKSILIKSNLSEIEINKISALKPIYPEFNIQNNWVRYYPYGLQTAHIIGYVGKISSKDKQVIDLSQYRGVDNIGKSGIEKIYEEKLRGEIGFIQSEKNAYGVNVRVLEMDKAAAGDDLFLSIDIRLQGYAESLLAGRRGSVVILDNQNGGVLTMVSSPSYDANLFIGGISHKDYQKLLNNPDKPLLNRSVNGQYPPGSIVKPLVAMAGIKNNAISSDEEIYCPGWYKIPNIEERTYYGWKRTGHGQVDMKKAIVESCDVYFYELASRIGINKINHYLSDFSLGKSTGIDLEYESSGLLPSTDWKRKRFNETWFLGLEKYINQPFF